MRTRIGKKPIFVSTRQTRCARTLFRKRSRCALFGMCLGLSISGTHAQDQSKTRVHVDEVSVQEMAETVAVIGRIVATQEGVVAARVDGAMEEVLVRVGQRVREGEMLARLDDQFLQARVDLTTANLRESRARLGANRARLKLAEQQRDRLAKLRSSASASKASYEDAVQNVVIVQATIAESQAVVTARLSDLRIAQLNLDYAAVRAPYDGAITAISSHAGAYVRVGSEVVHMLADHSMEIEAEVPVSNLAGLSGGAEVEATINGTTTRARVRTIIPIENPLTRTRPVRFALLPGYRVRGLASNQSITVTVPVAAKEKVVSVHKDAIVRKGGKAFVFLVEDGKSVRRMVELGRQLSLRFVVKNGVGPGDKAIVRGNERMQPGMAVSVTETSK